MKLLAQICDKQNKECCYVNNSNGWMCRKGNVVQELELWNEIFEKGMRIDRITLSFLINGFCLVQDIKAADRY